MRAWPGSPLGLRAGISHRGAAGGLLGVFADYSGSVLETELERWMSRCWVSGPLGALGEREGAGARAD